MIDRRLLSFALVLVLAAAAGCGKNEQQQKASFPSGKTSWIEARKLRPGPIRHDTLDAGQIERLRILQQTFSEVDSSSFEKWVDDFKHDGNPERQIGIYEDMAAAYRAYCSGRALTPAMKRDAYLVVLLRSGAPDSEVLSHIHLKVLSIEDAKEILKLYRAAPDPVRVSTSPGS